MTHKIELSGRDLAMLALLTIIWGLNWPIMKIGVRDFAPMSFRSISMIGGIPILWLIVRAQGIPLRVAREHWRELAFLALTNMVIWFILAIYGIQMLSSGRAAILGYTMPIWTALIGWALFSETPSRRLGIGVAAAAAGVALLLASELGSLSGRPLGTLCMLGAAFVWGFGAHLMRRRRQDTNVQVITFWSVVISLAVCGTIAAVFEHEQWVRPPNAAEWAAIGYNALLIFGVSQAMWFRLASILPPVASGLSVMLIPVVGLFSAMLMLDEQPRWQDWVALGCILVAIATVLLPAPGRRAPS